MSWRARAAAAIAGIVLLDRVTKLYIQRNFSFTDSVPVVPGFFYLVHSENPGAAFGMLAESGEWRKIVLIGVAAVLLAVIGRMIWRAEQTGEGPWTRYGLALIFGGALGNLWDRVFRGTVTDFLQLFFGSYEYPSFNAADSSIVIGASLLILDLLRRRPA